MARLSRRVILAAPAVLGVSSSFAQGVLPARGARIIIGYPVGGGTDEMARLIAASLQRRLSRGVQANVAYTWSRAFGICCDNLSDNPPQVQAMDYFKLNEATLSFDRPHTHRAIKILAPHGGHCPHTLQLGRQQGLPVPADVVAQARDDEHGGLGTGDCHRTNFPLWSTMVMSTKLDPWRRLAP